MSPDRADRLGHALVRLTGGDAAGQAAARAELQQLIAENSVDKHAAKARQALEEDIRKRRSQTEPPQKALRPVKSLSDPELQGRLLEAFQHQADNDGFARVRTRLSQDVNALLAQLEPNLAKAASPLLQSFVTALTPLVGADGVLAELKQRHKALIGRLRDRQIADEAAAAEAALAGGRYDAAAAGIRHLARHDPAPSMLPALTDRLESLRLDRHLAERTARWIDQGHDLNDLAELLLSLQQSLSHPWAGVLKLHFLLEGLTAKLPAVWTAQLARIDTLETLESVALQVRDLPSAIVAARPEKSWREALSRIFVREQALALSSSSPAALDQGIARLDRLAAVDSAAVPAGLIADLQAQLAHWPDIALLEPPAVADGHRLSRLTALWKQAEQARRECQWAAQRAVTPDDFENRLALLARRFEAVPGIDEQIARTSRQFRVDRMQQAFASRDGALILQLARHGGNPLSQDELRSLQALLELAHSPPAADAPLSVHLPWWQQWHSHFDTLWSRGADPLLIEKLLAIESESGRVTASRLLQALLPVEGVSEESDVPVVRQFQVMPVFCWVPSALQQRQVIVTIWSALDRRDTVQASQLIKAMPEISEPWLPERQRLELRLRLLQVGRNPEQVPDLLRETAGQMAVLTPKSAARWIEELITPILLGSNPILRRDLLPAVRSCANLLTGEPAKEAVTDMLELLTIRQDLQDGRRSDAIDVLQRLLANSSGPTLAVPLLQALISEAEGRSDWPLMLILEELGRSSGVLETGQARARFSTAFADAMGGADALTATASLSNLEPLRQAMESNRVWEGRYRDLADLSHGAGLVLDQLSPAGDLNAFTTRIDRLNDQVSQWQWLCDHDPLLPEWDIRWRRLLIALQSAPPESWPLAAQLRQSVQAFESMAQAVLAGRQFVRQFPRWLSSETTDLSDRALSYELLKLLETIEKAVAALDPAVPSASAIPAVGFIWKRCIDMINQDGPAVINWGPLSTPASARGALAGMINADEEMSQSLLNFDRRLAGYSTGKMTPDQARALFALLPAKGPRTRRAELRWQQFRQRDPMPVMLRDHPALLPPGY